MLYTLRYKQPQLLTDKGEKMIKVKNLRKVYKVGGEKVVALNNISLHIEKGEFCCIVGTSGSGKSTLLNMLAGLEKPTKGGVRIAGQKVSAMNEKQLALFRQNNIGFIFQSYNLMPTLTAVENVAFPLMFKGIDKATREKRARAILKEMGLGTRMQHKPGELSGGQQQRVGIARAFVGRPKVIFADEPTGNLDSATTQQVMAMLLEISQKNNITFVMVTHDPELAKMARRIITLKDGNVITDTRDGVSLLEEDANIVLDDEEVETENVQEEADQTQEAAQGTSVDQEQPQQTLEKTCEKSGTDKNDTAEIAQIISEQIAKTQITQEPPVTQVQ